ncbi:NAD-dependent epimerase/dehydratase family protein [Geodermatophilus sp. SYSU D00815]
MVRVLVAGATGAIGRPLVTALIARGHTVAGMTRDPAKAELLARLGAQPLVADALDRDATTTAVAAARPDVVVEQLTALPRNYTPEAMRATLAATAAVRTAGGDNVYAAAVAAGARRYVAQSGCYYYRPGDGLADEFEPWVEHGPPLVAGGVRALTAVEQRTLRPDGPLAGVALRYGFFHGPGTWFHPDGDVGAQVRAGHYPVLGTGAGRWSFVHVDDAVAATVAAVESDVTGAFNVCDDEPVPIGRWLPAFARHLGAPAPPHVSTGPDTDPDGRFYAETLRGADNHRARRELGFRPRPLPWLQPEPR